MKITVPTTWSDVTLKQYQELSEVPSLKFDDLDKQLKILSILTGVEDDYFLKVKLTDVKTLIKDTDFVNYEPEKTNRPTTLKINGRRFYINYIPQELIAGEYIDLMELTKDSKVIALNLHKIISKYLKPVNVLGQRLRGCYEKNDRGKWIQTADSMQWTQDNILDGLTMDKIFPMSGFFLTLYKSLMEVSLNYSQKRLSKELKKVKEMVTDLQSSGAGS